MTEPNTADLAEVRDSIDALRYIDTQIDALKDTKAQLQADIKQALGDNEIGVLDGTPIVTFKRTKRTALDQRALKAEQPELVQQYMTSTEVRTFRWAE